MDTPLVRHYRIALAELQAWQEPISQATLDRHVICQLTDDVYSRLGRKPMRQTQALYDELATLSMPTQVRVAGTGPWEVFRCACCRTCLVICTCQPTPCECEAEPLCTVREFLTEDLHHFAPHGFVDAYRQAERLTGESIDDWPYADFRTVDSIIGRSLDSPFWPWTSRESESPTGDC